MGAKGAGATRKAAAKPGVGTRTQAPAKAAPKMAGKAAPKKAAKAGPKRATKAGAKSAATAAPKAAARAGAKPTSKATAKPAGKTASRGAATKPAVAARGAAARTGRGAGAKPKPEPGRRPRALTGENVEAPRAVAGLSEEDQIRAAKFLPRELPKRLFEEERFLFPESYGQNRIRLLVRDPEWIFAYWDVKPQALEELAKGLGERGLALSRLTLRVVDPVSGGASDILLPPGARWWYVKTDAARRTYRAELGVTLPSGQFRKLAESNTVVTPRVGPSPEAARRRMSYRDARELAPAEAAAAVDAERAAGLAAEPWAAEPVDGAGAAGAAGKPGAAPSAERASRGGASDAFRPGGASDTFRR